MNPPTNKNEKNLTTTLVLTQEGMMEYQKTKIIDTKPKTKDNKDISSLEIYNKILELPEFSNPETCEKILDEDEYIDHLEVIITRDYFPDLHKYNQIKKQVKFFFFKIAKQ